MRKFLIRWWWTSDWQREQHDRVNPPRREPSDGEFARCFSRAISDAIEEMTVYEDCVLDDCEGTKYRCGEGWNVENPFAPEEEWIRIDEFAARDRAASAQLSKSTGPRITKIDVENRTVTFE